LWANATYASITGFAKNPVYAGRYIIGKTRQEPPRKDRESGVASNGNPLTAGLSSMNTTPLTWIQGNGLTYRTEFAQTASTSGRP